MKQLVRTAWPLDATPGTWIDVAGELLRVEGVDGCDLLVWRPPWWRTLLWRLSRPLRRAWRRLRYGKFG